jgi:hypothetical protein
LKWFKNSKEGHKLEHAGIKCNLTSKELLALIKNGYTMGKLLALAAGKTETEFLQIINKFIVNEKSSALYKYLKGK